MPVLFRRALLSIGLALSLTATPALAARVMKISQNPKYVLVSVDNPGEWPSGTRLCVMRRGEWVDCGYVTRGNETTAVVELDSAGGRVRVGDPVRAYNSMGDAGRGIASLENYPRHELVLGSSGLLGVGAQTTSSLLTLNQGTSFQISAFYNYAVTPYFQLGIDPSLLYFVPAGANSGATIFELLAGPTVNIPVSNQAIYNSFFLSVLGGFGLATGANTQALLDAELGGRIRLVEHVSFHPSMGILQFIGNGSPTLLVVRLVAFSFLF